MISRWKEAQKQKNEIKETHSLKLDDAMEYEVRNMLETIRQLVSYILIGI